MKQNTCFKPNTLFFCKFNSFQGNWTKEFLFLCRIITWELLDWFWLAFCSASPYLNLLVMSVCLSVCDVSSLALFSRYFQNLIQETFNSSAVVLIWPIFGLAMAQAFSHSFLLQRPRFNPMSVHVGFVLDKVAMGQVLFRVVAVFSCWCYSSSAPYSFIDLSPSCIISTVDIIVK